eukprot:9859645-Lingulodinium_polyedra.AAC.1
MECLGCAGGARSLAGCGVLAGHQQLLAGGLLGIRWPGGWQGAARARLHARCLAGVVQARMPCGCGDALRRASRAMDVFCGAAGQ